jgi:hypothetical protein
MLSPMGIMMEMRSSYGMQLGTGTYNLLPSLTYLGSAGHLGWGAQMKARIALEDENDEGYRWGNLYEATAWLSYKLTDGLSGTARLVPPARRNHGARQHRSGRAALSEPGRAATRTRLVAGLDGRRAFLNRTQRATGAPLEVQKPPTSAVSHRHRPNNTRKDNICSAPS